ncbi:hypothetical protein FOXB_02133 [Fusarium oxysporum f. sp. conglutinans Fo5176]|uniref:Uncharacterized protein n=1 Tax=Fusarium oxysporum (strain Fo5176) TaxID=660025 RepID=F9F6V8_FUSOF|nr:hypothetical protein FOXB_02133 [Fusarium oxysporum f. sp. conglutinans Fo5176]
MAISRHLGVELRIMDLASILERDLQPVKYDLSWTPADNQQYQMSAWIDAPPKRLPYQPKTW